MTNAELLITVLICAAATASLRFIPFLIFPHGKQPPRFVIWLGAQLPRAAMAMLVVCCLKDISFASAGGYVPAIVGVAITAALHVCKRQMILSIAGGTAVYMLLIRIM